MDPPIDPAVFEQREMRQATTGQRWEYIASESEHPAMLHDVLATPDARQALAQRDIGAVYALLRDAGISQRRIADLTGQSQSQVCEIIYGRPVLQAHVLERIADGLGVERGWLGVAHAPGYSEHEVTSAQEVDDDMRRRSFLAAASAAVFGAPILGEAIDLPAPGDAPLPTRLGMADVEAIEHHLVGLRELARRYGGQADALGSAANHCTRLMQVQAADPVRARLGSALAEMHTETGWSCFDSGLHAQAQHHYRQAVDLANEVHDGYQTAYALRHAGLLPAETGDPNHAIKLYQLAEVHLRRSEARNDPRTPSLARWLSAQTASACTRLDTFRGQAQDHLAKARDGWEPADPFDRANMNMVTAWVGADLGRIDTAEPFAAASVREWGDSSRRDSVLAEISLATLHLHAREPDSLPLARTAIEHVSSLRSVRARQRLAPLLAELDSRSGSEARELARQARRVATAVA